MKRGQPSTSRYAYLIPGAVLLVVGLIVELGFIRTGQSEVLRLGAARDDLRQRLAAQLAQDDEVQRLARSLGVSDLETALSGDAESDPVTFLGDKISEARLTRLGMSTRASATVEKLRRTRFSIRVLGNYEQILRLVRSMEQSPRLVTVDAFSILPAEGSGLEGRIDVSIYDPIPERQP